MKEAWHVFQIRRALLSTPYLGYSLGSVNTEMRVPQLRTAAASILYMNAVSLLGEAVRTRLTPQELKDNRGLRKRLEVLSNGGLLLDYDALEGVCLRRNEIAHEQDRDATIAELDEACAVIQRQLVAWDLAEDRAPYSLVFERSAMRGSSDPNYHMEHDRIARVMHGDQWVCELKQTVKFGGS